MVKASLRNSDAGETFFITGAFLRFYFLLLRKFRNSHIVKIELVSVIEGSSIVDK